MPIARNLPINPCRALASMTGQHVGLRVPDFEASKVWFVDKLDFRVVQEWDCGELRLAYLAPAANDGLLIKILGGGSPTERPNYTDLGASLYEAGYHHTCFEVASVDEALAELRRREVTVIAEAFYVEAIGRRVAFFADPWGNLFAIAEIIALPSEQIGAAS
jgi:lactoylglutathione lyase/glyoxylase I family protein